MQPAPKPAAPAQPTQPTQPVQPVQPAQPAQPVKAVEQTAAEPAAPKRAMTWKKVAPQPVRSLKEIQEEEVSVCRRADA